MTKVRFNLDNGSNIHSNRKSEWFDPVKDLGFKQGEWELLNEKEKYEEAFFWAKNYIDISFEEK